MAVPIATPPSTSLLSRVLREFSTDVNLAPYEAASPTTGWMQVALSVVVAICLIFAFLYFVAISGVAPGVLGLPVMAIVFVLFWLISRSYRTAQPHFSASRMQSLLNDVRPPILYLRSFSADWDELPAEVTPAFQRNRGVTPGLNAWSVEQTMAVDFADVGPMVAIGRPGDALPMVGAGRIYVSDAAWKDVVKVMMDGSRAIVLRVGHSAGLRWEVETIVARGYAPKTVLLTVDEAGRPLSKAAYQQLSSWLSPLLQQPLPAAGWNSWYIPLTRDGVETVDSDSPFVTRAAIKAANVKLATEWPPMKPGQGYRR